VRLRRDVLHRQDVVDRRPVGVLDDAVAMIIRDLLRGGSPSHYPHSIDVDLAVALPRQRLTFATCCTVTSTEMPRETFENNASQLRFANSTGRAFIVEGIS
jgi:hypothetical protein